MCNEVEGCCGLKECVPFKTHIKLNPQCHRLVRTGLGGWTKSHSSTLTSVLRILLSIITRLSDFKGDPGPCSPPLWFVAPWQWGDWFPLSSTSATMCWPNLRPKAPEPAVSLPCLGWVSQAFSTVMGSWQARYTFGKTSLLFHRNAETSIIPFHVNHMRNLASILMTNNYTIWGWNQHLNGTLSFYVFLLYYLISKLLEQKDEKILESLQL